MDRRIKDPTQRAGAGGEWKELVAVSAIGATSLGASLSLRMAPVFGGPEQDNIPWNPLSLAAHMAITQDVVWSGAATASACVLAGGSFAAAGVSAWGWRWVCSKGWQRIGAGRGPKVERLPVDDRAKFMGRGKALAPLAARVVAEASRRLKVAFPNAEATADLRIPARSGVAIGVSVEERQWLFGSYEDLHIDIWGPRQGKSTSRVIPAVLEAPGTVVTTSNKADVVAATIQMRREVGDCFVFDPQRIAGRTEPWSWDPLSYVIPPEQRPELPQPTAALRAVEDGPVFVDEPADMPDRDAEPELVWGAEQRAAQLAGHFADGDDGQDAKRDAFFDPAGEDLLAQLLLAAALADRPISQVWEWLTAETNTEPARILDLAGHHLAARGLFAMYNEDPKQRSGVFGTARKMARILKSPELRPWIEHGANRRRFDHRVFAGSDSNTLYLLSMEGAGSAGPILNALTAAVLESAVQRGIAHGGRLPTPLMAVLDEAANVVRWRDLPKLYSHFGSRGIVVMTVLQSWAQGERCWGAGGMKALWGAANVRVLGSGLDDVPFLRERAEVVGQHNELTGSVSTSSSGRSVSRSLTERQTLTVSELQSLARGRMVVFGSGFPATLCVAVPFWQRPYGARVQADIDAAAAAAAKSAAALFPVQQPSVDGAQSREEGAA
ncbi:type IV secretory system conjugative DNA transfer family protein [Nocardia amamiensis]|uniref:type IV secretory system conjugative DNA transfer family protein n=1 Tax=Nocardia amamiensis TaxID=404578 RepID=UPI00082F7C94|nr:type IV secretory system conjugative DNA transfer family protein [Nocardia amamiensis]